jgi:hypothetical protein
MAKYTIPGVLDDSGGLDRTIERRLYREFTTVADKEVVGFPRLSTMLDGIIEPILRPYFEAGKILKSVDLDEAGKRVSHYAFQGSKKAQRALYDTIAQEVVGDIKKKLGGKLGYAVATEEMREKLLAKEYGYDSAKTDEARKKILEKVRKKIDAEKEFKDIQFVMDKRDPETGTIEKVFAPIRITGFRNREYNAIRQRFADSRAKSAANVKALRAGGFVEKDAEGIATHVVPRIKGGVTGEINKIASESNILAFQGEGRNTDLAFGANDLTTKEKAEISALREQVAKSGKDRFVQELIDNPDTVDHPLAIKELEKRQKQADAELRKKEKATGSDEHRSKIQSGIWDDTYAQMVHEEEIEKFMKAYPYHPFSKQEMAKRLHIVNRQQKAEFLEKERELRKKEQDPNSPEYEAKRFRGLVAREKNEELDEKFIRLNPKSRRAKRIAEAAKARDKQRSRAATRKVKSKIGGAVRIVRNALAITIGAILTAVTMAVSLLAQSFKVISQIGTDVRKRAIEEAKYNLDSGTLITFENFAKQHPELKKDPEIFARTVGGVHYAWSDPLNYSTGSFNQLSPYLKEEMPLLVSMATADGKLNVLTMMDGVIDALVKKSLLGESGSKRFDPVTERGAAIAGNITGLTIHNADWGKFMSLYIQDLLASGKSSVEEWKVIDKDGIERVMNFTNWRTQADWHPDYQPGGVYHNSVIDKAANQTDTLLQKMLGTFSTLARDIAEAISAGIGGEIVERLRHIADNVLARWLPAFAMKENERAIYLNQQSKYFGLMEIPRLEKNAQTALTAIGFNGTPKDFRPYLETFMKTGSIKDLPLGVNLRELYKVWDTLLLHHKVVTGVEDIDKEIETAKTKKSYVQRHIPLDSANTTVYAADLAQILQAKMNIGAEFAELETPKGKATPKGFFGKLFDAAKVTFGIQKGLDVEKPTPYVTILEERLALIEEQKEAENYDYRTMQFYIERGERFPKTKEEPLYKKTIRQVDSLRRHLSDEENTLSQLEDAYKELGWDEMAMIAHYRRMSHYKDYPEVAKKRKEEIDADVKLARRLGSIPDNVSDEEVIKAYNIKTTEDLHKEALEELNRYENVQDFRRSSNMQSNATIQANTIDRITWHNLMSDISKEINNTFGMTVNAAVDQGEVSLKRDGDVIKIYLTQNGIAQQPITIPNEGRLPEQHITLDPLIVSLGYNYQPTY